MSLNGESIYIILSSHLWVIYLSLVHVSVSEPELVCVWVRSMSLGGIVRCEHSGVQVRAIKIKLLRLRQYVSIWIFFL